MFETLESGIGLDIILWLQDQRTDWMAILTEVLDQLGAELGYVAILGLIYWLINKRQGIRLIFALVAIALVTFALKDILMRPRPFVAFPELVMPAFETSGYGLPSGHTSFAVVIWGYIALWLRKSWMWVFAIFYITLQAAARMLAGVHYPQDIALGLLIGLLTLLAYRAALPHWEAFWQKQTPPTQYAIAIAMPLILCVIVLILPLAPDQIEAYLTILGLALGVSIGVVSEPKLAAFRPAESAVQRGSIFVIGVVLTVAVLLGLSPLFDLIAETGTVAYLLRIIRYALAGWIAVVIVPLIGVRIGLLSTTKPKTATA